MAVNERRNDEPAWCVKTDHGDSFIGLHRSRPVIVGSRRDRGEVTAWLSQANGGPVWVQLLAAHMMSCTVDIGLDDARQLRDGLTVLLEQAGYEDGVVP